MVYLPNAKINLGLNIVSKRQDGYHDIETIFYPIAINDALEIVPATGKKGILKTFGIPIDGDPGQNLVIKAYLLLKEIYSLPEFDIYLRKNIPFGAGLGSGSSDAAYMLKLLNKEAGLSLSDETLELLASQIGADCPFFIKNTPVFASGTGNVFKKIALQLTGYHLILVKPPIHVSTKEAYSGVVPQKPQQSLIEIIKQPVNAWKELMFNDFEPSVFARYPAIEDIKQKLYGLNAVYASMSGSGSSVFGIFEDEESFANEFPDCKTFKVDL